MNAAEVFDPKGLIRESFVMEGIGAPECRSIFLDWALGVPAGRDTKTEVERLLAYHRPNVPSDHPMLATLQAALADIGPPKRRGGRSSRVDPGA